MKARKFEVVFEPDDGGWHVSIPSVSGCRTWGRSLAAARRNIREALGLCVDVLGENAERVAEAAVFVEDIRLPAPAKRDLERALAKRKDADAVVADAQAQAGRVAKMLTDGLGLSLRDAGDLLGLSHERVKQLADALGRRAREA